MRHNQRTAHRNLELAVQYAVPRRGLPGRATLERWVRAALLRRATIAIRFVGGPEGRGLNRRFRSRDYATNVLTFIYQDAPLAGDIVLCAPVVGREAREQGKPLADHYAHLVVHGVLHLQGLDHMNRAEARVMEDRERRVLARLGIPDPYVLRSAA